MLQKGQQTTQELKTQVNGLLSKISGEGSRLADLFGSNNYSKSEVEQIIKESSLSIKEIQGITACFEPFAFSESDRLYCPHYNKGDSKYLFVEDSYDYTNVEDKSAEWYTSIRDNGAKWVEPYFAKAAQDWYVDYGIPFYHTKGPNKGKVKGTITMSFISSGFKEIIHQMSLGKTGFGLITSTENTLIKIKAMKPCFFTTTFLPLIGDWGWFSIKTAYFKTVNRSIENIFVCLFSFLYYSFAF